MQGKLTEAMSLLLNEKTEITGAGRTDTGVHADYYVAHFDSMHQTLAEDEQFVFRLNKFLPVDIAITGIKKVKDDAHARFNALSRSYKYRITRVKNPFETDYAWYYYGELDIAKMQEASQMLLNFDDFKTFSKKGSDVKNHLCKIMTAGWNEHENILEFNITADRFLRNMVRSIVATLMEIGKGNLDLQTFEKLIHERKRPPVTSSAPAHGLYLNNISHDPGIYILI